MHTGAYGPALHRLVWWSSLTAIRSSLLDSYRLMRCDITYTIELDLLALPIIQAQDVFGGFVVRGIGAIIEAALVGVGRI